MVAAFAVALAGLGLAFAAACTPASALPLLSHHGRWLVDPEGRVVILHGEQIDKYEPTQPVEHIDLNPENVRFMAAQGFNVARVSMAYAGVEPQLGHTDQAYVNSYLAFDRQLGANGIYDLLDMMQGQYSQVVGGWGLPNWMTITGISPNNPEPFPDGYFANPAEGSAWDNFWANAPASDGVGLQDHYANGVHRLAGEFAGAPGLLGIEVLNEPWPGSLWPACASPTGCPPGGFDQTSLTNFYRRLIPAIRSADPQHPILYEPNLLFDYGAATGLSGLSDPNLVFAFHNYCLAYAVALPDPFGNCSTDEQIVFSNAAARAVASGDGLLMDEWGNTPDVNTLQRIASEADQQMVGWTEWAYEDCCNSAGAIVADGSKPPTAPGNLRTAVLSALVRPYPQDIAGTPTGWSYDPSSDAFSLTYSTHAVRGGSFPPGAETEVEVPALHYPTGYNARVTGAHVTSAPDANLLLLQSDGGGTQVHLTITPAKHHPAGPGPFTESGGARADCSAHARQVIGLRTRHRGTRVTKVHVYINGRRAMTVRGKRIRRIRLPAGLADGSVIKLVIRTAHGQRRVAIRHLRRCRFSHRGIVLIRGR